MNLSILSLFFIFLFSTTARAQKVGEAYVKDGIPCIIIDIDEDTGKGLVMTMVPTSKAMKAAEKTGDSKWFYIPKKEKKAEVKLLYEYVKELFHETKCNTVETMMAPGGVMAFVTKAKNATSLSGKENMQQVIDFCDRKGISIETYFPEFAWAQSLGEDWYIPGVEELNYYIKLFGYEAIGKEYKISLSEVERKKKEASNIYISSLEHIDDSAIFNEIKNPFDYIGVDYATTYFIMSSTIAEGRNRDTYEYVCPRILGGNYFELTYITDLVDFGKRTIASVCAVCEVDFRPQTSSSTVAVEHSESTRFSAVIGSIQEDLESFSRNTKSSTL